MTNKILLIKKIAYAVGIVLLMSVDARADVVFSTDFTTGYVSSGSGSHTLGGATPDVAATDWFGSTNGVSITAGDLTLGNTSSNRYRGAGVWLDTTGWVSGLVTVEVDVANFQAGTDSRAIFQAFAANGVDASSSVSLDLHGAASLGGDPQATGGATIGLLGAEQEIVADGTDVAFTFNFNGTDQFVGLVFANVNAESTGTGNTADLDNLTVTVTAVPEPSSLAILVLGLGVFGLRRRLK